MKGEKMSNAEPMQLFYIENYENEFVIFSAFRTKEVFYRGPYQIYRAFQKLRDRKAAVDLRGVIANPAIAAMIAKNS